MRSDAAGRKWTARGRWRDLVKNYELRFYLVVNLFIIAILFFCIRDRHPDTATALRFASEMLMTRTP